MKAYAVRWNGAYWLVYAPTAARAKGLVIQGSPDVCYRPSFKTLQCRRWPAGDDGEIEGEEVHRLGTPGERDYETGVRYGTPEPWQETRHAA